MVQPATTDGRAGGGGSTAAMRGVGRGDGSGVRNGAVVCGADIEPVTSAVACSSRSEILAIWVCAVLLACSRLAFSVVTSLPSRSIDCCIALFCSMVATSGRAGVEYPPLASAPTTAPSAAANVTDCLLYTLTLPT